MYKYIGIGAIAIILGLGLWFNWPHDGLATPLTKDISENIPPEFSQISGYLNTPHPFTLASLRGQVVLLHFWRIGCPDCQQDVPTLNYLYSKYHPYGLVVVGIHSPQMAYEMDVRAVESAVHQYGIQYPVLLDNTKATWNEYGDSYWPLDVLIGKNGYTQYRHYGIGDSQGLEQAIRTQLAERNIAAPSNHA
jgi:thiol-disulfide isomerase/thioredoxin